MILAQIRLTRIRSSLIPLDMLVTSIVRLIIIWFNQVIGTALVVKDVLSWSRAGGSEWLSI